jgi:hypothetical protein
VEPEEAETVTPDGRDATEPTGWTDACQVAIIYRDDYARKPIALASRGANAVVLGGSSRANASQP